MSSESGGEAVRWYTEGRKLPTMLGKLGTGSQSFRIPGGPYSMPQVTIGGIVFVFVYLLRPLWSSFGGLGVIGRLIEWAVCIAIGLGGMFAARFIRTGVRNPLSSACAFVLSAVPTNQRAAGTVRVRSASGRYRDLPADLRSDVVPEPVTASAAVSPEEPLQIPAKKVLRIKPRRSREAVVEETSLAQLMEDHPAPAPESRAGQVSALQRMVGSIGN